MSPTHLARTMRDLLSRAEPPPAKPYALLVLVLFVIWLLATGYDLASAVAAAVAVSWAAGGANGGGALPQLAGAPTGPTPRPLLPGTLPASPAEPLTVLMPEPADSPPDLSPPSGLVRG